MEMKVKKIRTFNILPMKEDFFREIKSRKFKKNQLRFAV